MFAARESQLLSETRDLADCQRQFAIGWVQEGEEGLTAEQTVGVEVLEVMTGQEGQGQAVMMVQAWKSCSLEEQVHCAEVGTVAEEHEQAPNGQNSLDERAKT
jgi:hypothetical protein